MDNQKKEYYLNRNVKMHPLLNALTWDVIFVWTISTIFLSTEKGLSYSNIVFLDSILMCAGCVLCIPIQKLFKNVIPKIALRVGLFCYAGFVVLLMIGTNFFTFAFGYVLLAIGYAIGSIKVNPILTDSLSELKRDKDYNRVFGKGYSLYYIIECVGAVCITYVYSWKPYMCFVLSLVMIAIGFVLTFFFKEPKKFQASNLQGEALAEPTQKPKVVKSDSYLKILKSSFFIFLLFYAFMLRGVLSISSSSYKIYLNQLIDADVIPMWAFGIMFAASRLLTAILNKYQFKFNLKFGVRSLLLINFTLVVCFITVGVLYLISPTSIVNLILIVICCCILCSLRSPNQIFVNNYLRICMPKKNLESAHAVKTTVEYLGFTILNFTYAGLLSFYNDNLGKANLTYIAIFAVPLIISMVLFIRILCKKHAEKFTIIKDEYTKD